MNLLYRFDALILKYIRAVRHQLGTLLYQWIKPLRPTQQIYLNN
jgi:hypothetical protein